MSCQKVKTAVICSFEYTNNAQEDFYMLKRDSPLEGEILAPFMSVYREGEQLKYEGIHVDRDAPTSADYILLRAGETLTKSIKLTDAFNFGLMSMGMYTIQYMEPLYYLTREKLELQSRTADEIHVRQSVTIYLKDTSILDQPFADESIEDNEENEIEEMEGHLCETAKYLGGDEEDKNTTSELHELICKTLRMAKLELDINPILYKKWFGAKSIKRSYFVKKTFDDMITGLHKSKFLYHIGKLCKPGHNGYMYSDKGKMVAVICEAFLMRDIFCNRFGSPSREGMIVNLLSKIFGRTAALRRGMIGCLFLAKYFPKIAIHNSGNYENFYCESRFE